MKRLPPPIRILEHIPGWRILPSIALIIPVIAFAAEPWEEDRIFWLDMNWYDSVHQAAKVNQFDAAAKGPARGKPLSADTWAVASYPMYGLEKNLPSGASDQAVEWPAAGNVEPSQGAISLLAQGQKWDAANPQRETFLVIEGKAGSFSLEKNKPNTLAVALNGAAVIEAPIEAPNRCHHLVVNWETDPKKKTARISLYDNRKLVGSKEGVALPAGYDRIVVGQLGAGPGTNKMLDNVAIYRRPLAQGEITKIYYLEAKIALPKRATVPFASQPPKIDGIFNAGEWDHAAKICGFVDETAGDSYVYWVGTGKPWDVKDAIRLMYDDKNLYFAYHCPPPDKVKGNEPIIAAMLKNTKTGFDTDVDADDVLFIDIHKPYPAGDMYHLIVNGMNTHYEFSDGGSAPGSVEKGRDLQFNPKWITASTLTLDGWKLEGAIPFADLKMQSPKPGDTLHINFMRYWRTILSGVASWAHGVRHGPNDELYFVPAGEIQFGAPDAVAFQLAQIGNLAQGNLDFQGRLINPGAKPARVRVEMTSNTDEVKNAKEIEVPAQGAAPYEFKARVTKPETGDVTLRITDLANNALIFASGHPLFRPDHPNIYLRKYPSWKLVKFETDFDALSQTPAKEIAAELEVAPAAAGDDRRKSDAKDDGGHRPPLQPITKQKAGGFEFYSHTFEFATSNAPPGRYEARIKFTQKGKPLDTASLKFDVKDLPVWNNNTIGNDDPQRPPYPFTRMELRGNNEVCVWGRIYRWGESLLPAQIEVNPDHANPMEKTPGGRPLLRGAMRLVGQADEAQFSTDQLKAAGEWTDQSGVRIAGRRKVTVGNLAITADVETEYDGFTWVKLTLAPVQGQVELRSLAFEEPFTPEFSDVVNTGEYSLIGTGKFPDQPFLKSAVLPIWIGNGDGGLQTFLETLETWHVKDLQTTMQLQPGKEGGTLRYNLVDKPLVLTKPRVIEFGWNATPTRLKEWRTFREQTRGHRTAYFAWYPGPEWNVGDLGWAKGYYNGPCMTARYDYGSWERGQPYMNTDAIPVNDPDAQEFGDEWLTNPDDRWRDQIGNVGAMINVTYASKTYRDWILHKMNELFQRAPFGGWYYDVVQARASANPYAGAGILREDGTRAAKSTLRALREVTKRLYTLCRHTYPDGAAMIHDSGMPNMAYMAFCEVFFDGENLNSSINAQQPTYRGVLTPERFRAEYMGHNFGPQLWWLGQNRITKETAEKFGPENLVDHMTGLMLLHDAPVIFAGGFGLGGCNEAQLRNDEAVRRYELYGCGYRFLPYWRGQAVTGLKDRQFVSWYIRQPLNIPSGYWRLWTREETDAALPHRAIGVFCNESDWKGEMTVKVDIKRLGFKDGAKIRAVNAVHSTGFRMNGDKAEYPPRPDETATLKDDDLRFPMTEWNYRMIVLEEEK
ncbi:MAG: hypothetical protein HY360_06020 [Verrucomicrobia bacterium]|nr:hypothetical protein [Verrucomicrobiota bacterium]